MEAKINDPCDKNWNKMTSVEGGRYCSFCDKVVVDFTSMRDDQIKRYFTEMSVKKTCGHFKTSQVYVQENSFTKKLRDLKSQLILQSSVGISTKFMLYIVSIVLMMTGCVGVTGKVALEKTGDSVGITPQPIQPLDSTSTIEK